MLSKEQTEEKATTKENTTDAPLFTGDRKRDTAVSETEKAVEASAFLWKNLKNRLFRKKKKHKDE